MITSGKHLYQNPKRGHVGFSEYMNLWIQVIETMQNDNTYKLAWGKALIEIVYEQKEIQSAIEISFEDIAHKMLKYYWNQQFFFNLKQSPGKKPIVVQETERCIEKYIDITNSNFPVWFDKAEVVLKKDSVFYNASVINIARTLRNDVCWRFMNSRGVALALYSLDITNMRVIFTQAQAIEIKHYAKVLSQLLNYRWAELLEKFNSSPRIVSKVKGISDNHIKRRSLQKYRDVLVDSMHNGVIIDFYTGNILDETEVSVDHVIPWSFMYSDDIWNLVVTSKSHNSSKSNVIPLETDIQKLNERNNQLLGTIKVEKMKQDLALAIENNYVSKYYLSLQL